MRSIRPGRGLATGALLVCALGARPAPAAEAPSYESLAREATRIGDVATLLAPFVDSCAGDPRDVDRARCLATTAYLRRRLPRQTFVTTSNDPAAIDVSSYDALVKGYRVAVAGCIACTQPLAIGRLAQPRFVTVRASDGAPPPGAGAASIPLSHRTFAFPDLSGAKQWLNSQRPFLRAEFLIRPPPAAAPAAGATPPPIALALVGARVYNRCTGEVLVSTPPSDERAPLPDRPDPDCGPRSALPIKEAAAQPEFLSKPVIDDAMAKLRPRLYECFRKFHMPGKLELSFVINGNGTVRAVRVGSFFAGTSTGSCALEIAKDAGFPAFQLRTQEFTYPFFLR